MKLKEKQKEQFMLFCILLLFIGILVILTFWNANGFFTEAYSPIVEDANARQTVRKKTVESEQPRPAGFKEKEIEKRRGDRFATY